jgi:hypothetical protein
LKISGAAVFLSLINDAEVPTGRMSACLGIISWLHRRISDL